MFTKKYTVVAALSLLCCAAYALPSPSQIYRAEDNSPGGNVTAGVLAARTAFLGALNSTVQSFGFENPPVSPGAGPTLPVTFAGSAGQSILATLNGSAGQQVVAGDDAGRFNTTAGGDQYWRVNSSVNGSFSISFNRGISAFGFYGTDVGDFGGVLSLVLTPWSGGPDETLVVRPSTNGAATSGALLFYGFADMNSSYRRITFLSSGTTSDEDYFGFDDLVVADSGQIRVPTPPTGMPEPGSLVLAGLALFAAGSASRYRKARKAA